MLSGNEKNNFTHNITTKDQRRSLLVVSTSSTSLSSSSSSSSLSSNYSSSPSPFSPSSHLPPSVVGPTAKTMEEVWKDINLSSREDLSVAHHTNYRAGGLTFQDFLARPFTSKDHHPPTAVVSAGNNNSLFDSPAAPPPPVVLSLNSGHGFQFLESSDPIITRPPHHHSHVQNDHNDFSIAASAGLPSFGKKRVSESENGSGDRRHKRMIKNRESAARSRARKQAYTNELELEVAQLMEENARLKSQQEQLCIAAAAAQLSKKHTLHRTSTAPF